MFELSYLLPNVHMNNKLSQDINVNTQWRETKYSDLPKIMEIASQVHVTLPERQEVFADKISLSSQTCLVLQANDIVAGYALSHPWRLHHIPPLDSLLGALPHDADCLYVHDVVVLPEFRGKHAVASLIQMISELERAKGMRFLALVSVYHTTAMWERFGFRIEHADAALATKLSSYGETAQYMVCELKE